MLKAYLATLIAFLVIDGLWIGLVARKIYADTLGDWMRSSPGLAAAGLFYALYAAGIVYLAVQPAIKTNSAVLALLNGAVLGALAYGAFTVTNYAILERWTLKLVVTDLLWGTAITAVAAFAGYLAAR